MATRYSLAQDFGLKQAHLLAKLEYDQPGSPAWRSRVAQLLRRAEDQYTLDEIETIAEVIYTRLDAGVLREPDGYRHGDVKTANNNRIRQEQVLDQLSLLRSKKKGKGKPRPAQPRTIRPNEKGIVLESINTSRMRVVRDGEVLGYIWRTRTKGGEGEHDEHLPGWTHSRSHELFVGTSSKLAAREDLIRMVDAGKNARTKNPAWLIRQLNLGGDEQPARRVRVQEKTEAKGSTWRIGLFKSARGKLSAAYVNASGEPLPYERRRVGDRPILIHRSYSGMTYKEARQKLLAEAKKDGLS